jgi:hypothetical protein
VSQPQGGSPPPASSSSPDGRSTEFRPVDGSTQLQSGEKLLVQGYAAIWLIAFALVLFSWSRVRKIDDRLAALEGAVGKARAGGAKPASPKAE